MSAHRSTSLRFAVRSLLKNPSYSGVVVITLALGIAANTVVFSLMNPYFFRPLPYRDADRLVQLGHIDPIHGWDGARFSYAQLRDYARHAETVEDLAAYYYGPVNLTGPEGAEQQMIGNVTSNLPRLLGTPPMLGPGFDATADGLASTPTVLLAQALWQRRFGGDPAVIGRTLAIDGVPYEIAGVMPDGFNFPFPEVRLWRVLAAAEASTPRDVSGMLIVGRLAAEVDREQAREELNVLQRGFAQQHPEADGRYAGISVKPLRQALNFAWDILRLSFTALIGAVLAVLLIACVNVASLSLARAAARRREMALRAALGARRGRLVRQLLTEGLILAAAGGILGVGLTFLLVDGLGSALPDALFRAGTVSVDFRVLAFAAAMTLLTLLVFGWLPARAATRADLASALADGDRGGGPGRSPVRGRRALVVAEVALAVVLTTGAGLMLRSLWALGEVDLGFRSGSILTAEVSLPESGFATAEDRDRYDRQAVETLGTLPGVRGVGVVSHLPLNHETIPIQHARPGREPSEPEGWPLALTSRADASYFAAMGIDLLAGRGFAAGDRADGELPVVISRRVAEQHWGGGPAVGRSLLIGDPQSPRRATVIGVVADVRYADLDGADRRGHVYRPLAGSGARRRFLVIDAGGAPAALTAPVAARLAALDADVAFTLRPMDEVVGESALQWRVASLFLGAFGAMALLLAAVGLYGLVSYSLALRRRELGVRSALGARRGDLRRLVLVEGLRLTAVGLVVGVPLALAVGRLAASMLFGVGPFDAVTLGAVALLMAAMAMIASLGPARRAARIDPATVLRAP